MREYIIKSDVGTELTVEGIYDSEKRVARNTYSLFIFIIRKRGWGYYVIRKSRFFKNEKRKNIKIFKLGY